MPEDATPFSAFVADTPPQTALRRAITAAARRPEADVVAELLPAATLSVEQQDEAQRTARALIEAVRGHKRSRAEVLLHTYRMDSDAGRALLDLAEALPRIPDAATRALLLRDRLVAAHWMQAGTFGTQMALAKGLALTPLWFAVAPLLHRVVSARLGTLARHFVLGERIGPALDRAERAELAGFTHSFDMLGESALTAGDAERHMSAYTKAIAAVGAASGGRGVYEGPGVSVKLSALHPRYERAQRGRVMAELLPRLKLLAAKARALDIGFTIDAEESARLDLSLDLLEALATDKGFTGWHGLGFAVQAYSKRAPQVLDFCIDLARSSGHRLMIRLVKGAYWDGEIKRAQQDGVEDFPVFTRKPHTDVSFLACARKMLAAGEAIYPQFATHNALTMAAVHSMAAGVPYELQCLHGMGETLHEEAMRRLGVRSRIYAPVGPHAALLAYLVRRLLENGASSSFIRQLHHPGVPVGVLLLDPVAEARRGHGAASAHIRRPPELFGAARRNAKGFDVTSEAALHRLARELAAVPPAPAVHDATAEAVEAALAAAASYTPPPAAARAHSLTHAAALLERYHAALLAALVTEGRKTLPAAMAELREAVDYLRYYGEQVRSWAPETHVPLGTVLCISPWNFPLAIFLGQVAAAFAAGNAVLAKPAEQTPRVAALAVKLLHIAGVPHAGMQLLAGDGTLGATLVADARVNGVVFTGSTVVAKSIQATLATRTNPDGKPVPLIAETAGQNAMIVDSSALPEQVIADVLASAFDSAGQRCSALRLLCVQREMAPLIMPRLRAALAELRAGPPGDMATDIPPLISGEAAAGINAHIAKLRAAGRRLTRGTAPEQGGFVPPMLVEVSSPAALEEEIFGPVLHVLTYHSWRLDVLIRRLNALGYGLTFGLHTRIATRVSHVAARIRAGNIYVNRNMIGAVVGVQPFGGYGLSGTGPKAGGPLYLYRLLARAPCCRPRLGELPGPVGESNMYMLLPRGAVLCVAQTALGRTVQAAVVRAAGCRAVFSPRDGFAAVLLEGDAAEVLRLTALLAARPGPILPLFALTPAEIAAGACYNPSLLAHERLVSTNTAASGGNPGLLSII
jgi:RHH-type proline utilization regulon transcriptional repressor/proline dehydrogenase/delta 1-pyrroline-5-carboxylate dehydrogenase